VFKVLLNVYKSNHGEEKKLSAFSFQRSAAPV